ncbi:MAG TPA: helix-turn-helix domain-containing protein [Terriglobia bacterium]|nr:helix-turn-helix domain-containing protein [Terriglobia bacterium]
MKRLTREKQVQIISALIEGNSIRATARMFNVSKDTVLKLQVEAGYASADFQDKNFHGLPCKRVQCDEVWAFCYAKEKNVPQEKKGKFGYGDVWTWTAIDAQTKLIPSFTVGNRDAASARILIEDLAGRLRNRIQLTTDGHRAYLEGVEGAFGCDIDYAMLVKTYESSQEETRYSPAVCTSCERKPIMGHPDPEHISTSFVERSNLSIRMGTRRFTRLTNAFSKKIENHAAAVALYFMHYNYCRVHQSLRVTPCMEAGLADHVWSVREMLEAIQLPCGTFESSY